MTQIPVKKGDILKLKVISIGKNGDLMMKKDNFSLFLKTDNKMIDGKYIQKNVNCMVMVKVVKLFSKLGYVELI